ncbi:helix-turn-helix domain-containing protein [Kitasatospora fiedleri]|uniref:helix-turn-helix domain-containing protein n=1 Tax=Kitasatospora fiedleri TaxID=2991545 RepID=UPI00249A1656|nr:helix-turn-helix transcriptional regulator [Kitasatospora fiedleri]
MDPALPVGERIKMCRERAGKSRAVVAGLVGRSTEWLKAAENGRLLPPRLPMLTKLAEAIGVGLQELTGDLAMPAALLSGPEHPALRAVRRAIDSAPLGLSVGPVPDLRAVEAQVSAAWALRDASGAHRTALGDVLPSLITVTSAAASHPQVSDRRQAAILYASALNLAQMFVSYQGDGNLVWRVSERALATARAADSPTAIAQAVWFLLEAFRTSGQWDSAHTLGEEALRLLDPVRGDSPELAGAWASLAFQEACTYAVEGVGGLAWHWFDRAAEVASVLPAASWHSPTSVSGRIVPVHAVTVAVELRQVGTALRWAGRVSPDELPARPRRSRHMIETARAHALRGDHRQVVEMLTDAVAAAPDSVRWNAYARGMARDLLSGPQSIRADARDLALTIGVAA